MTGGTELRLPEKRTHHSALVTRNVGENLLVCEITKDRCAIFFRQQSGSTNREAAGTVEPGAGDGVADGASNAFIVESGKWCSLAKAFPGKSAREQGDRCMTAFTVTSELNSPRPQKNVNTLTVERFARRVPMQRFGPGCVRISMAPDTSFGGEELINRNQLAVFSLRI